MTKNHIQVTVNLTYIRPDVIQDLSCYQLCGHMGQTIMVIEIFSILGSFNKSSFWTFLLKLSKDGKRYIIQVFFSFKRTFSWCFFGSKFSEFNWTRLEKIENILQPVEKFWPRLPNNQSKLRIKSFHQKGKSLTKLSHSITFSKKYENWYSDKNKISKPFITSEYDKFLQRVIIQVRQISHQIMNSTSLMLCILIKMLPPITNTCLKTYSELCFCFSLWESNSHTLPILSCF